MNERLGMDQYLVPYLMSSHPGSTLKEAVELAEYCRDLGYMPEQVQDFYPTPSTLSTCMYYTGIDPRTGQSVYVPKSPHEKAMQLVRGIYEQHTLLKEGDLAADFRATKYAGGDLTLTALRGKVVLLNFWATWCGPCLRELAPEALPKIILERFAADSEFVFLPVAYTDSKESLDKFFAGDEQQNYAYLRDLTAMDPDKRVFGLYAEQGVPRSFVIDRNGRIVLGSLGAAQEELERIAAAIEKELSR